MKGEEEDDLLLQILGVEQEWLPLNSGTRTATENDEVKYNFCEVYYNVCSHANELT